MNKLKKISILTLMSLILSAVPLLQANATSTKQRMQVWVGNNQGQTIDQDRSFVVVTCDTTGMVNVVGHLHKTNQISKVLKIAVKRMLQHPLLLLTLISPQTQQVTVTSLLLLLASLLESTI